MKVNCAALVISEQGTDAPAVRAVAFSDHPRFARQLESDLSAMTTGDDLRPAGFRQSFTCTHSFAVQRQPSGVSLRTSRGWTCWADLPSPIDERNSCAARPSILGLSVDLNLENS